MSKLERFGGKNDQDHAQSKIDRTSIHYRYDHERHNTTAIMSTTKEKTSCKKKKVWFKDDNVPDSGQSDLKRGLCEEIFFIRGTPSNMLFKKPPKPIKKLKRSAGAYVPPHLRRKKNQAKAAR